MNRFTKNQIILFVLLILSASCFAQQKKNLKVPPQNIVIKARPQGDGFDMYVKKTADINSILLTESVRDYAGNNDSYAYRATEYNEINGDEIRYLNGQILTSDWAKFSLVDSTPEKTPYFEEEAFHIFIPLKLVFGYTWARQGQVEVGNRTFINIRAFEKKYADHSGEYDDSPYYLNLKVVEKTKNDSKGTEEKVEPKGTEEKKTIPPHESIYNETATEKLAEISEEIIFCKGPSALVGDIEKVLERTENKDKLDVIFAIDGTGSMEDDLYALKHELVPAMKQLFEGSGAQFGLLYYRDYDEYVSGAYKELPVHIFDFGKDLNNFTMNLNSITAYGGGDTPEAVYEAIFAATDGFDWREGSERRIILIGDAEPHPEPRGTGLYSKEYVMNLASQKGIKVTTILLP